MRAGLPSFPELWAARVGELLWPSPSVSVVRPEPVDEHPLIKALRNSGKPLTNGQLAKAIGCSQGQATKYRRKFKGRLIEWRQGRYVFVTLADFDDLPKDSVRKLNGKGRKS